MEEERKDKEKKGIYFTFIRKKVFVAYISRGLPVRCCSCSNVLSYGLKDAGEKGEEESEDVGKKGILLHLNQKKRGLVVYIRILPLRCCRGSNILW